MSTPNTELRPDERADNNQSLGTQLRATREARGVSLREISDQTRISMRHLEAIEMDNYKELPGGIFNRSFIKSYARYVRFEEGRALELYSRTARELGEDTEAVPSVRERVYMNGDSNRSPLVTGLMVIVLLAVLAGGVYFGLRWWQARQAAPTGGAQQSSALNQTNIANTQTNVTNTAATAQGLSVRISVKGSEPVWVSSRVDDGRAVAAPIQPNAPRDLNAQQSISLRYDRTQARNLEIFINNRPSRVPAGGAEVSITRDNVQQFLQ